MTDRIKGCWVGFERDIREDDVESIVNAILHIKGVSGITTEKAEPQDFMARSRMKAELFLKLNNALHDFFKDS